MAPDKTTLNFISHFCRDSFFCKVENRRLLVILENHTTIDRNVLFDITSRGILYPISSYDCLYMRGFFQFSDCCQRLVATFLNCHSPRDMTSPDTLLVTKSQTTYKKNHVFRIFKHNSEINNVRLVKYISSQLANKPFLQL